jgi:hypothetical protein
MEFTPKHRFPFFRHIELPLEKNPNNNRLSLLCEISISAIVVVVPDDIIISKIIAIDNTISTYKRI